MPREFLKSDAASRACRCQSQHCMEAHGELEEDSGADGALKVWYLFRSLDEY